MIKLKNCPLCASSVELIDGQDPSCLAIVCGCGLRKSIAPRYDKCKEQLIVQWNRRPYLEEAHEATLAYNVVVACPGILIEPGAVSGCSHFDPTDCPTCAVVDAAENE